MIYSENKREKGFLKNMKRDLRACGALSKGLTHMELETYKERRDNGAKTI